MKKEIFCSKNICLGLGVIFGSLIVVCYLFAIPSSLLLIISGIQTFELGIKKKKHFEDFINYKLKNYEDNLTNLKKDCDKNKSDIESVRMRQNVTSIYGKTQ